MEKKYIERLVSVIIPTFRRSEKLPRAIESVLNQTYTNLELFVVNDNDPNDEYTRYVKEITAVYKKDSRFNLIIQDKHINGAVARNIAITKAQGQYIAFLDDDDWWVDTKLEKQVKELELLDDSWGGVSCKFTLFDKDMNIIGKTHKYQDGYIYKDVLSLYSDVATGTLLLRHSALDKVGYFDETLLRNQDIQLLTQFTYKYKLKQVDRYLHCVDVSDTQNRPISESNLLEVRKALFESVENVISTLTKSELRTINSMRDLELGYIMLKQKKYMRGLKYVFSILKSPSAFILAIKKLKRRYDMKNG